METTKNTNGITIRRLGHGDEAAIERLVELDSGRRPEGELMGVEIEGRLLVAELDRDWREHRRSLQPHRRAQGTPGSQDRPDERQGQEPAGASAAGARHSRGALAGSPPGAGGKLLTLPVRLG